MYGCKSGKLGAYLEVIIIFFVHKISSQRSITARDRMQMIASGDLHKCNCEKRVVIYYVRETERGMMAADSELTKQLSSHTLLKNSIKFK